MIKSISLLFSIFSFAVVSTAQVTSTQDQYISPKEYLVNGGFELAKAKWGTYVDAAGVSPVDCSGGSGTVALTTSTTSPLQGKSSGVLTKPASNVQGQGYVTTFDLDKAARTKTISVSGVYEIQSGTYSGGTAAPADSDLQIYIYDIANATVISPTGLELDGATSGLNYSFNASFTSPQFTTATSGFRLCVHHSTTSTSAFVVKLDQVKVVVKDLASTTTPVLARYTTSAGQSIGIGTFYRINFGTIYYDSHSAVTTGASWRFTAPVSGIYEVTSLISYAAASWTAAGYVNLLLYKNGTFYSQLGYTILATSGAFPASGSDTVQLNAGDYIDLWTGHVEGTARSLTSAGDSNHVQIKKID